MFDLAIHPRTGVQALGFTKHGYPIWPVMGGSQPLGDPGQQSLLEPPPTDPPTPPPPADGKKANALDQNGVDLGYPVETAPRDMTIAEQANYFKHQQRRKDDKLKEYDGITPEQAKQYKTEAEAKRREGMQPDERALEDARTEAAKAAKLEAAEQWAPEFAKQVIGQFVQDKAQRDELLGLINPMTFMKDGVFDSDALIGKLTALSTAFGGAGNGEPPPRQWGQQGDRPPPPSASAQGLAEAERRFGKKES